MVRILSFIITLFIINHSGYSQTTGTSDFYAGKWEISIYGSPRGDVVFKTELIRVDGKLTGKLINGDDIRNINKVEESDTTLKIYFNSSQGGEINITLSRKDQNNLQGRLMEYEAKAIRVF